MRLHASSTRDNGCVQCKVAVRSDSYDPWHITACLATFCCALAADVQVLMQWR